MNLSTECLEAAQVELLLQGNLTPPEYATAQEHLEVCEQCRARVEETIGPEQWWGDVQSVLLNSRSALYAKAQAPSTDADSNETPTAKLLDLLGPTDDPHMLGRIGSYEIIGLLGQGGMGAVFKGFDRSLNRFVAIKMLLPHLAASGAARKRFAREGQAVAAVVDDHVMAIHCVDEWQGIPYLVMTYSRGVSLQKRLSENGPLEVREILRIGMQAAKGLAAAHAQGIVHRDIKPANIFLDQNVERVQLMDFGLARAVDDASLTRSGTLAGTPQYMSPEQARAETVDHRSDLFSLGSVLYAMCTGHAPFRAESSYSVLRLITDKEPRAIREINPDIPIWLCAIIGKLMAKNADDRFASAQEVAELLENCLAHVQQPTTTPLPDSLVYKPEPRSLSLRLRNIGVFAMSKNTLWQFSIRAMLIAVTLYVICAAIAATYSPHALKQRFILSEVLPFTEKYVSSVGYANGRIVWLRVNNIDAHHPNHFDEWIVPIAMDVASNDGLIGKYKDFGDLELKAFVTEHSFLRALDVRQSKVTEKGMVYLKKLKHLEWLWLDREQATEVGLANLDDLSELRTVWLPLEEIEREVVERLRIAMPRCKFDDSSLQIDGVPNGPDQPLLSKTLRQLQGRWRLTHQIALDGDESITPTNAIWEFKGDRIIVRDSGPGGAMLIEVDDTHSPVHVDVSFGTQDESGLGLLSIEGDKLILCLGESQKSPEPESRPKKLQWVCGVWYIELQRVKPGESIAPMKPDSPIQPRAKETSVLNSSTATPPKIEVKESKLLAIDHGNARSVVEAYVGLALAGDVAQAAALAKNTPADPKRIAERPKFLNFQRLNVQTVYVNDPAQPT